MITGQMVEAMGDKCFEIEMHSGRLHSEIIVDGRRLTPAVELATGQKALVCEEPLQPQRPARKTDNGEDQTADEELRSASSTPPV